MFRLFKWFGGGRRGKGIGRMARTSLERPVTLSMLACCVLLAFLGAFQFVWIGQVSESQGNAALRSLHTSTRLVVEQFQAELRLLLMTFNADADFERTRRMESYKQRYLAWHALSVHGPAVKRILFYDLTAPEAGDLTELVPESGRMERTAWDSDLAPVRQHIEEFGFIPGRVLSGRWIVTWMFHPQAMAIHRPMVKFEVDSRNGSYRTPLSGYLIVQLDGDFLRDR